MESVLLGLRAAAEPTRLRLLWLCARAELSVGELTLILGQSQPRVSRHLKLLCEAGLLDRSPEGTRAYYRLAGGGRGGSLGRVLVDLLPTDDETLARDLDRLEDVRRERGEAAAAYFRKNAARWDQIRTLYVDEREVGRRLLGRLPGGHVGELLDIGTGTGRILELMASSVERAVGLDLSREMLGVARANLEHAGLRNCALRHGDMYQLPWAAASFDAVTIHQVLCFAETPGEVIAEAARVLRPGGWLAVVDFAPHQIESLRHDQAHRWLGFADREIDAWYRATGLAPKRVLRLPGDPLTVNIWPATREAAPSRRARRGSLAEAHR